MTIAELVGHFGIKVPRYVTMDGRIVFTKVSPVLGGGFTHPAHGSVTPIQTHTFHGGEEPNDEAAAPDIWWHDESLLIPHIEAMASAFPQFQYTPPDDDLAPAWFGKINTGRGSYDVGIVLRRDRGLPRIVVLKPGRLGVSAGRRWIPAPHMYLNGNLCVADSSDWDRELHTAATAAGWTAHWFAAYTEWRMTRRWPTKGFRSVA